MSGFMRSKRSKECNMSDMPGKPIYNLADVDIQQNKVVYDGHYKVYQLKLRHKCFNGEWSALVTREQFARYDASSVILYDPKQDKVVLVEQLRIGLLNRDDAPNPWMLEIVAGLIDQEPSPEDTIHREAIEEAGCKINQLIPIGKFYNTPGGFTELTYVYCGLVALSENPLQNQPEEDEDIKIHILAWDEVQALLQHGWVTSASSLIAIQWLENNRKELMAQF